MFNDSIQSVICVTVEQPITAAVGIGADVRYESAIEEGEQ